jgi:hypothetical protein
MATTILNTSIVTAHGTFTYKTCSLEQAKELVDGGFESAIGHESTASVISTLLGINCPMNRIQYQQQVGDIALIFKLKTRAPEGAILTIEEIEEIGYEWGILKMKHGQEPTGGMPIGECFVCSYVGRLNPDNSCPICRDIAGV